MATYLMLAGLAQNFRVAERDGDKLRGMLRDAMEDGKVIEIRTEMGDDPTNLPVITVNGAALGWFTVLTDDTL